IGRENSTYCSNASFAISPNGIILSLFPFPIQRTNPFPDARLLCVNLLIRIHVILLHTSTLASLYYVFVKVYSVLIVIVGLLLPSIKQSEVNDPFLVLKYVNFHLSSRLVPVLKIDAKL